MKYLLIFALVSVLLLGVLITVQASSNQSIERTSTDPKALELLVGTKFPIDIDGAGHYSSSVAKCYGDEYLVVYEEDAYIWGRFISENGELLGNPIMIYNGNNGYGSRPDVACDQNVQIYIVTWTVDYYNLEEDYDIYARGIHGTHSDYSMTTAWTYVATTTAVERNSRIACNESEHTCLVVFEICEGPEADDWCDINMQRLAINSTQISLLGDLYEIWDTFDDNSSPDVAFGGASGNYLVVWKWWYISSGDDHYRILWTHIYDDEQGDGAEERQHNATYLVNPADSTEYLYDQTEPAVAYSWKSQSYMVAFVLNENGINPDIRGRRVPGTGQTSIGVPFYINGYEARQEFSPAITYNSGASGFVVLNDYDQFIVTFVCYMENQHWLLARTLFGTNVAGVEQRNSPVIYELDYKSSISSSISAPAIIGAYDDQKLLATYTIWQSGIAGTSTYIYGVMLNQHQIYLPSIIR